MPTHCSKLAGLATVLLITVQPTAAQYAAYSPKRELRAIWVATAENLDYPEKPTTWPTAQRQEWKDLLEDYRELGFNAVFFQIRPAADAFYPSELVPWSAFLTGKQGLPPDPEYDLLQFLIEEAHRQGLEFHAWMTPFRASTSLNVSRFSPRHVMKQHPGWVLRYGGAYFLNPGIPAVREHLSKVVMEVVDNYDIDGLHFDGYFYPEPIRGLPFPDEKTFAEQNDGAFGSIGDWRRDNLDQFIKMVSESMKSAKPHLYFGISPYGIWRNDTQDRRGSPTAAEFTSYDDLYADALKWAEHGWVDYLAPQLYWPIDFEPAGHSRLQRWWSVHKSEAALFIGHNAFKIINGREAAWREADELPRQIGLTRRNRRISGHLLFSSSAVLRDPLGLKDSLRQLYQQPALIPERPTLELRAAAAPKLKKVKNKRGNALVRWQPNKADEAHPPHYYVLYRFQGARVGRLEDAEAILRITEPGAEPQRQYKHLDRRVEDRKVYTYVVTAVNRAHQESRPSQPVSIRVTGGKVKKF